MNKTLNINLGGLIFHIDEDAYHKLDRYLTVLKRQFAKTEGGNEIIKDIEIRISELFRERTTVAKEVISLKDVDEVIEILGKPEDYLEMEEGPSAGNTYTDYSSQGTERRKKIYRDPDDKVLGGVASGLAAYFNVDALWIRIIFILLLFSGFSILFYIILWMVVPKAKTTAEKLQMRGQRVNISNIERSVKEELGGIGDNVKNFGEKASNYDYTRPANQFGDFIRDFTESVINVLGFLFRFIFKLIGFGFLAMGFMVLLALIIGFFSGSFHIVHGGYGMMDLYDFLKMVAYNDAHFNMLAIGISLLTLSPLILIIYLGVRIIFKLDPLGKQARAGLTGMAIIGFILVLVSGIRIGLEFERSSYYTTHHTLEYQGDKLYLGVKQDALYEEFQDGHFNQDWLRTENANAFSMVQLDIRKSNDDKIRIKQVVRAQGNNRRAAREHAQAVKYQFERTDSLLSFNYYYMLGLKDPFRGQEVELVLYLPVGKTIYLNNNAIDLIYDIDNVNDYWDFDMVNHSWTMTEKGLRCDDCPEDINKDGFLEEINSDEDFEEEDYEEQVPESDDDFEMEVSISKKNGTTKAQKFPYQFISK